jgi:F-type H+-transporting ATPase subunit b
MEEETNTHAVVEVPSVSHAGSPGLMDVSTPMLVLTWITFLVLLWVLSKLAWKPILKTLDMREKSIRHALDEAEKARAEAAATDARNRKSLQEATEEARRIIDEARTLAQHSARQIQVQSAEQARVLMEEAQRDIQSAVEKARLTLRAETGALAIELAGKVIGRNMDSAANQELVKSMTRELDAS